jgi:hypothetical protein
MSRPRLVFRKRVKLFGPVHLNVSLHHVGLGVSVPGASFSINSAGRRQVSVGVPGSGMRVQQVWNAPRNVTPIGTSRSVRFHALIAAIVVLVALAIIGALSK